MCGVISARLRELRGDENVNAFSSRIGVQRKTWAELENMDHLPSLTNLLRISEACDVDIDWIVGRSETRNKSNADTCSYTGLSEKAAENLHGLNEGKRSAGFENVDRAFQPEISRMELDLDALEELDVIEKCGGEEAVCELHLGPQKHFEEGYMGRYAVDALSGRDCNADEIPCSPAFELSVADRLLSDWRVIGLIARYLRTNTVDIGECPDSSSNALESDIVMMELIKKELSAFRTKEQLEDPMIYHRFTTGERIRIGEAFGRIPEKTRNSLRQKMTVDDLIAGIPMPCGSDDAKASGRNDGCR
jgi:transcriptional regulator with XRE-family HTH domain